MDVQLVSTLPPIDASVVGFDIETTRLFKRRKKDPSDPRRDRIVALSVSDGKTAWVLKDNLNSAVPLLTNPDIKKVAHNAAFDVAFLNYQLGISIENIHDTLLAERTLHAGNTHLGHGLDDVLARRYGVFADKSIRSQFEDHTGALTDEQLEYSAMDSFYLPQMREDQMNDISKAGMGRVMAVENGMVPIVAQMTLNGVGFDQSLWESYLLQIEQRLQQILLSASQHIVNPSVTPLFGSIALGIDLGSADQIADYLSKHHNLQLQSTKEAELSAILQALPDHPACPLIQDVLAWREWDKRRSWAYHEFIHPITGRIHATWKSQEARTGRIACEGPNLMQVELWNGDSAVPNLRLLFIPTADGRVFIIADYGQQEPRIFAQVSGDEAMRAACREADVYIGFGRDVFHQEITKGSELRQIAKTLVLAGLYGAQPKKLASVARISVEEATDLLKKIRKAYPTAAAWADSQLRQLSMRGYTTTLLGRKRYFPDLRDSDDPGKFRNMSVNTPIQGSGADMFKLAAVKLARVIKENNYDAFPALFVHDELVVESSAKDAEEVYYQVIGCMEEAGHELCPDVETIAEGKVSEKWVKA